MTWPRSKVNIILANTLTLGLNGAALSRSDQIELLQRRAIWTWLIRILSGLQHGRRETRNATLLTELGKQFS